MKRRSAWRIADATSPLAGIEAALMPPRDLLGGRQL